MGRDGCTLKATKDLVKKYHALVEQFTHQNSNVLLNSPTLNRSRSQIIKKKPVPKKLQVNYKPKKLIKGKSREFLEVPQNDFNSVNVELIYEPKGKEGKKVLYIKRNNRFVQ